jgi:hypothetical protein
MMIIGKQTGVLGNSLDRIFFGICTCLIFVICVFLCGCNQKEDAVLKDIKEKMLFDWTVSIQKDKVIIKRNKPVYCYNPISLPPGPLGNEMIEKNKYQIEIAIILEFADLIPDEAYYGLYKQNSISMDKINEYEKTMNGFWGKGRFDPKTDAEKKIYEEYSKLLQSVKIAKLPDLKNDYKSIYLTISTPSENWAFYNVMDYFECKAMLSKIFSIFESYGPYSVMNEYDIIDSIIYHRSMYEAYLEKIKNINLN